ncbi:phosphoribosylaminoimidazolecarboxamide formyltransferase (AICAR transformylase)-IMP cyclohydrolase (inosinicase) (IMP synthetase) (ATIC) [Chondrus crispus]|uniref:Phosphoribosylaminoimidazolecarboxamide formyltransferase (AICAR transformylase)-IMP cyclohydrolase (Inosinicase) (IMP synthetase) (ATIC) n=1 Tax=Chondrus crispus TaxID=2769 RepID=R7Q3B1_CHOCR|nr:phosphoribosylaminoimidazolecarboxamide formyltransferase (AICAR transformylase)-IMP cyclohydrolase (inosinicase) (IMP synthetase) (ATIC) [Chondrus crispus]CDF32393.1 phosphoribosylaminoimidazolecarboxamide formyltransferase (AICAR transformylase)-IMP cyclohydrolase (inosinicase) (IMP synthetase) (ATIC) [Chondrus crispus]|eukprot:XP_005712058.1 phosphoribosylaminoimidazolecarboxamide formyltransferase (AICAR transformylase)-IMP cyclohydrolase (inosinicase) (IMP synthetase) (ATIC) [Chondrus crispus]
MEPPTSAPAAEPQPESPGLIPIRRALISVSDKNCLLGLARVLAERGVEILSTGGTFRVLQEADIPVNDVSQYTGFPELMGGRVKTLHPKIHGGLLAVRDDPDHAAAMEEHDILPIDLVVVNLYPFEATVAAGKSFEECVENIDVGGPTMIRGASKNFRYVTVVTDVQQYTDVIAELDENDGATSHKLRRKLAAAAFGKLAAYDAAVAKRFSSELQQTFPDHYMISANLKQSLRYGENPHQLAAFYSFSGQSPGLASAEQVQGKALSFNNISDTDAAFELVSEFTCAEPVCAIIKHANPCGVASGVTAQDAYLRALACDPTSAFGGIVALNVTVDLHVAEEIAKVFTEVVIAPDATVEALEILSKKKNLRVMLTGTMPDPEGTGMTFKSVSGGMLLQTRDNGTRDEDDVTVASKKVPTDEEMKNLLFAWKVCKHVKSNAIVYVRNMATVGTGAGQMSRVDASRIAAWKAEEASSNAEEEESRTVGSVVASDAFFPFADGLLAAADAGATAVIQPGGSKRDAEVIAAADERGIAVVLTGMRHFKH